MRALVIIDIQNDYFPGGRHPLHEPEAAARAARDVLDLFRERGEPVFHVQHVWDAPDAPFLGKDTPGGDIHPLVTPRAGEPVVQKEHPNAFLETTLRAMLDELGVDEIVVAGMMTSMCVDASVRAATDAGFAVTLVHDACAAPALSFGGVEVPGTLVHTAFVAALDGTYATAVSAAQLGARD